MPTIVGMPPRYILKVLKRNLNKKTLKYYHFELKCILIQENKFPRLIQDLQFFSSFILTILTVCRLSAALTKKITAMFIRGRRFLTSSVSNAALIGGRRSLE